jgi:urease accessory protein
MIIDITSWIRLQSSKNFHYLLSSLLYLIPIVQVSVLTCLLELNIMALNPFQPSKSRPGYGEAYISLLPPQTPVYKTLNYTYPLKLISSSPHILRRDDDEPANVPGQALQPDRVPLLFMLTYGGGLLPGDSISFDVTLEPSTRLTIATQGSTKVFPSSESGEAAQAYHSVSTKSASQHLNVKIGSHSALLLSPDPVQPFRGSHYSQVQTFNLDQQASLGLLDWVTSGRPAREEIWDAGSWTGRNEVWRRDPDDSSKRADADVQRRLILRDALYLEGGPDGVSMRSLKAERKGVFGTLILLGPVLEGMASFFLTEFSSQPKVGGYNWDDDADGKIQNGASGDEDRQKHRLEQWRKDRLARERINGVLWTAARVRGIVVVKFAAEEVEGAKVWLNDMFTFEGTIEREFGPGGLLSVR